MKFIGDAIKDLRSTHISILNWGSPITGKTQSLSTLRRALGEKLKRPIKMVLFDFDHKANSLIKVAEREGWLNDLSIYRYTATGRDKIRGDHQTAKDSSTFLDFMRDFNAYHDMVDPKTGLWKPNTEAPDIVVFDSLTAFSEITLEFVLAMVGHNLSDPKTDARADYGKQMGKIMEAIKSSKTLPCIIVWNAHEQFDKDEVLGKIKCEPLVTGKLAPRLASEFNIVLYSLVKDNKYQWYARPQGWVASAGTTERDDLPPIIDQDYSKVI